MNKFDIGGYSEFSELPLQEFNGLKYSVYVLDQSWNYLFVNDFVGKNIGEKGNHLVGKNMWKEFEELGKNAAFQLLKSNSEKGKDTNLVTNSPITGQRLNIIGHALKDCYIFTSSILPKKEDLIQELRQEMGKGG